jgi:rhodanese-related sulfurtransferase
MDANSYLDGRPDPVQVVDVRRPDEWEAGHLEGARNLPLDELEDLLGELDKGTPILTVCRTGVRSAKAVDLLAARGFDAESIEGGVVALAEAGVPLVDAAGSAVAPPEEDDGGSDPEMDRMQDSMIEVMVAMQERFGDTERTEADELEFLREFLARKGKTPEEIEAFMSPE